ncbi:hypothetical protein MTO96_013573 [Rhipicephalus appendiculatus]
MLQELLTPGSLLPLAGTRTIDWRTWLSATRGMRQRPEPYDGVELSAIRTRTPGHDSAAGQTSWLNCTHRVQPLDFSYWSSDGVPQTYTDIVAHYPLSRRYCPPPEPWLSADKAVDFRIIQINSFLRIMIFDRANPTSYNKE